MIYLLVFGLGLIFASFLGALMYRTEKEIPLKEMLFTRSHCDNCKRSLEWYDLIPVLSYIFSKGKCTKCGKRITMYYPISEIFLGIGFVLIYINYSYNLWFYLFLSFLFSLSYFDLFTKTIPKWLTHTTLAIGILYLVLNFSLTRLISIEYFVILAIVIFLLNRIKESFGLGDILLFAFFSFVLEPSSFLVFLLTTLYISALFGIVLIIRNRKNLKAYIPLVPFMTIAFVLTPYLEPIFKSLCILIFGNF